jgi:hypothetical protein
VCIPARRERKSAKRWLPQVFSKPSAITAPRSIALSQAVSSDGFSVRPARQSSDDNGAIWALQLFVSQIFIVENCSLGFEHLLTAYLEEVHKVEERIVETMKKLPDSRIDSFTALKQICTGLAVTPTSELLSTIMEKCQREKGQFPITDVVLLKYMSEVGMTAPFVLSQADFAIESQNDNLLPFVTAEFQVYQKDFDALLKKFDERGNDTVVKYLRGARVKFDQALTGRSTLKIFEANVRDFFEKGALMKRS